MAVIAHLGFVVLALCSDASAFIVAPAPRSICLGQQNAASSQPLKLGSAASSLHAKQSLASLKRARADTLAVRSSEGSTDPGSPPAHPSQAVAECPVDFGAMGKYVAGTAAEFGIIMGLLSLIQANVLSRLGFKWARATVFLTFGFLASKSRTFGVLNARRPTIAAEKDAKQERKRPDWMPPVKVFPVVWITIGILRAVSSTMVWEALGNKLVTGPIAAMVLHLSVGDTWNHINNVEKRLGVAVPVVFLVWLTVANVVYRYYQAIPKAGLVILPSLIWITIANFLVQAIWRLNGKEPLYPEIQKRSQ